MSSYRIVTMLFVLLGSLAFADDVSRGWNWNVGCPESGADSPISLFTSSATGGFTADGNCRRNSSRFTKFSFQSYSGGTLHSTEVAGLHTGDVMVMPRLLLNETKPVFAVSARCPMKNKVLNWIFAQWADGERHTLVNYNMMGTAIYDIATGIALTQVNDVAGTVRFSGTIPLAGSCSNGRYTLSGTGDRGGAVDFTANGSGTFKADSGRANLFLPQYTITSMANDFGGMVFPGLMFDGAADNKQVRMTANAAGLVWTVEPYSDSDTGAIDSSFTDTITFTGINVPSNGFLVGTVTRAGNGAGTGRIACVVAKGVATRITCSGETPWDNTIPYSIALAIEGPQIIGQPSGISYLQLERGLRRPSGVSIAAGKLFVADTNASRVLIWNSIPNTSGKAPDVFIGQRDIASSAANNGGVSARSLAWPMGVFSDGSRIYVADKNNHRVLIWNSIPTVNRTPADIVLGQPNMTSNTMNNGGVTAQALNNPYAVYASGSRLYVADSGNARVLIWNSIPTSNRQAADLVLGQPDMLSNTGHSEATASGQTFAMPVSITSVGSKLFVGEGSRVLVWNTIPTVNRQSANYALGQPNLNSYTINNGGMGASSLNGIASVTSDGTSLFVADGNNNRVLGWNAIPTTNGQAANFVLGQPNMTSNTSNTGAITSGNFYFPQGLVAIPGKLFVTDLNANRVLAFNNPSYTGQGANIVLGQANFNEGSANGVGATNNTLYAPKGVFFVGTKMIVADTFNNRVLIWNSVPKSNYQPADLVLGQPNMTSFAAGATSNQNLRRPSSVFSDGTRLFVADSGNYRVLIWNTFPTTNYQAANLVLGQPSMTSMLCDGYNVTMASMCSPSSVFSNGTKFVVTDMGFHRIQIWNSIPTSNNQSADVIVGQSTSTGHFYNMGAGSNPTNQSLWNPAAAIIAGTKLVVADGGNNRILVWNSVPTSFGAPATYVLGQANFTSWYAYGQSPGGTPSPTTMSAPAGLFFDGTQLYATDVGRILIWKNMNFTAQQTPADYILGDPSAIGMTSKTVSGATSIQVVGTRIFVSDSGNSRVIALDAP